MKYIDIISNLGYDVDNMEKRDNKKLRDTISTIKKRVSYVEIRKDYDFQRKFNDQKNKSQSLIYFNGI